MGKLSIIGLSAIEFWRNSDPRLLRPEHRCALTQFDGAACSVCEVRAAVERDARLARLPRPLHVAVPSKAHANSSGSVRVSVQGGPLAPGSFVALGSNVYVASPEQCLLIAAASAPLVACIAYGYELCGSYAVFEELSRPSEFNRAPLSCVAALRAYVAATKKAQPRRRGLMRAAAALGLAGEGAASAREAALAMFLSLPHGMGGAGLGELCLNRKVFSNEASRKFDARAAYQLDISWPGGMVDVEYDGRDFHGDYDQVSRDNRRRNALGALGYKVYVVANAQLRNPAAMEGLVQAMAADLGVCHRVCCRDYPRKARAFLGYLSGLRFGRLGEYL